MRYFHQSPDYWLDHCTLPDWNHIYARELAETPTVDEWAGAYFKHEPDVASDGDDEAAGGAGEWECPFPDETE